MRDSSVAAPGRAVRVQGCTVPLPWQGLRLTEGGYGGVYVEDGLLELQDAVLHPGLQVPLKAERGEIAARNLRLAYPDGDPLAVMKTLSLAPGVLWADDLSRETSGRLTALLPWWWTIHAREAVADPDVDMSYYRLRFELDLEHTPLPVPLGADVVSIVSLWPPPVTIPVKLAGAAGAPAALEVDVDMAYENPDEKAARRFALMLVPAAITEKR